MAVATFDTLKFSKALREAGVPEKQADAEAVVLSEVFSVNFRELATKEDLGATKNELKVEIKHLEERIDYKFKDMEQRLTARLDVSDANSKSEFARVRGEQMIVRWMLGATMSICAAIAVRMFFFGFK